MIFPIIAALSLAIATIMEKVVLVKKGINSKLFQVATFLAAVLFMLPLLYFFWDLEPQALQLSNILIMLAVIAISVLANYLLFFALKWEKVSNIEPAIIMEPLFTVLLAVIFSFFTVGLFDRNPNVLIPALIAAGALIFSHVRKAHLDCNKYVLAAVGASFLFALELVISRVILDYYSPISLYFVRCLGVLIISFLLFRPKLSSIKDTKVKWEIFLTGALWVVYRVLVYYGFLSLGVISTILIVMLAPVFVYLFAKFFLKEKLTWRNIVASIIIIACVAYVYLL